MPYTSNKTDSRSGGVYSDIPTFEGWKGGLDNIHRPNSLSPDNLVDAYNVDFDDNGKIRTREGLVNKLEGNYGDMFVFNKRLYVTKDGELLSYDENYSDERFIDNIDPHYKMYFLELLGNLYFSNSINTGIIDSNHTLTNWEIDSGIIAPIAFAQNGGQLPKGTYLIAYSYLYGQYETGLSPIETVVVDSDNSKITVSVPQEDKITGANIYLQLGTQLHLMATGFTATITEFTHNQGKMAKGEILRALPKMNNLGYFHGRIFGTVNERIYFSEPFDYRQYNPKTNSFSLDNSEVICLLTLENSILACTKSAIYSISGEPLSFTIDKLYDIKMVEGTLFKHERKDIHGFLTDAGVFTISSDGQTTNISETSVEFSDNYTNGASMFRMKDGIISVIFSLEQTGDPSEYESEEYIKIV